ncbi:hypothetical protein BgiBS90_006277 [Biomphalaria glabrata]|nr:hypothetical protein BgiMline_011855 [Biomphalaria glabrata]KAI8793288.1 hypothetical protein BgiBS90_006277 [Biomphalaria glabrata]
MVIKLRFAGREGGANKPRALFAEKRDREGEETGRGGRQEISSALHSENLGPPLNEPRRALREYTFQRRRGLLTTVSPVDVSPYSSPLERAESYFTPPYSPKTLQPNPSPQPPVPLSIDARGK